MGKGSAYPWLDRATPFFENLAPSFADRKTGKLIDDNAAKLVARADERSEEAKQAKARAANDNEEPPHRRIKIPHWDEYFHMIAQAVAVRSKDQRQVGAVIVGEGKTILSTGFNGFARGVLETPERQDEDEKLFWVTHAETNAIFNAARHGISLVGSTLYVTMFPCTGCAQAIIQAGIKRVFTYGTYWVKAKEAKPPGPMYESANRWEIAADLFAEAAVSVDAPKIREIDGQHHTDLKGRKSSGKDENPSVPPPKPTGTDG